MADLSGLVESSRALTSHLARRDLPSLNWTIDQLEAQSRRLVSGRAGTSANGDNARANYLLAEAHVDASALADSIANLNASTTFSPLQPIHDADIAGFLRHAHEQNLVATIEQGRWEAQKDFHRILEERGRREWEAQKKRVFEELGGRLVSSESMAAADARKKSRPSSSLNQSTVVPLSSNLRTQSKMLAYDKVVIDLNRARLRGISYPVVHTLLKCSQSVSSDHHSQIPQLFHILTKITAEPPSMPPLEHAGTVLNAPRLERKYARVFLGDPQSREAVELRKQIAKGGREALEAQYCDVIEKTIQARRADARLGGDPSMANRIRAFLLLRYYRAGAWEERIELVASQPLWAKLFYLVRTGHLEEALKEASIHEAPLNSREPGFVSFFKTWINSPNAKLPKTQRDHLQSIYNTHLLNSSTVDTFKLALFRLMGKFDPSQRSIPLVTATTEDWLWFQIAMVDEDETDGLRGLATVIMTYGERHFEGNASNKRLGMWATVLLLCGEFERAVAALDDNPDTKVEAVHLAIALAYYGLLRVTSKAESSEYSLLHLSPVTPPALNFAALIRRYVRPFAKYDSNHALQYIVCICLSSDQQDGAVGKQQIDIAWSEVRKLIVLADEGTWDQLVGGLQPGGTRFTGFIEQLAPLLTLQDSSDYNEKIAGAAAAMCERERRTLEAIKLYNIAGDYETVLNCLAVALGNCVAQPDGGGEDWSKIEPTARQIDYEYSRLNRAAGKARDAVHILLKIHDAMAAKVSGRLEVALEAIESTDLVPLDGNTAKLNRKASEFETLYHDSVKRNLPIYLPLTMEILSEIHKKVKSATFHSSRKATLDSLRVKSRSLVMYAGLLRFRMLADVYSYLARLDVEISL